MFENQDETKNTTTDSKKECVQTHSLRSISPLSIKTLRGQIKTIGNYQFSFDQKLGSGLTSDAYSGIETATLKPVCVKIIDREIFKNQAQKSMLANEIECQQKLDSQHIIKIYDVYNTGSFCFVVTQLCEDGDLFKLIQYSRVGLSEGVTLRLGTHLAQALAVLKQNKIIHRDIKSQNIMLRAGIAKLGDFGFAILEKNLKQKQFFSIGSPLYMPLEALQNYKYSYESDIFSLGVVLYEMLHCQSPWECNQQKQLIQRMKKEPVVYKNGISPAIQSIINCCLQMKAQNRGQIQDVVNKLQQLLCVEQSAVRDRKHSVDVKSQQSITAVETA